MSRVWVTSDTHFFHKNIIKYTNRPFHSVEEMNMTMIENWNKTVKVDDIIFHLGDFALGDENTIRDLLTSLNGRKILIQGNHDIKKPVFYRNLGFSEVYKYPIFYQSQIILSHKPQLQIIGTTLLNFHGHIHEKENVSSQHFNLSVEQTNYTPIQLDRLITTKLKEANNGQKKED